jgi:restriction endonuclease S subunit
MYKKLSQIAEINTGYTFRESLKNEPNGDISVIQAKNILENIDISNLAGLASIYSKSLRNPYFLQYNDILLVSRGSGPGSFRSAVFGSHEKNVIASSSVHIIRIADVTVIPKYISLYLNSADGQKLILQIVTGASYIQSILLKNLSELQIPIPPIHVQKSIIALHENIVDQEEILDRKQEILKTIINSTIINLNKK